MAYTDDPKKKPPRRPKPKSFDEAWDNPDALDDTTAGGDPVEGARSFDEAWDRAGADSTAPRSRGPINLGDGSAPPAGANSGRGRGLGASIAGALGSFSEFMNKDRAPAVRSALDRLRSGGRDEFHPIGVDPLTAANRKPERRPGELPAVTITAPAPSWLERAKHLFDVPDVRGSIQKVMENTAAGVNTPYENSRGEPGQFTERDYATWTTRLQQVQKSDPDPARRRQAENFLRQLAEQKRLGTAMHPQGMAGFLTGAADAATFGLAQTPERYAAKQALKKRTATGEQVTPEDLMRSNIIDPARGDIVRETTPGASGAEVAGDFGGTILPFELAERAGIAGIRGLSRITRSVGAAKEVGTATRIADALGGAADYLHNPIRGGTDIGNVVKRTVQGAARGQIGGAAVAAGRAAVEGEDIGDALKNSVVGNAVLGGALGAAGAGGAVSAMGEGRQFGARINYARDLVEQTRPDPVALADANSARAADGKLPLSDQTVGAQHRNIANALGQVLEQRRTEYPSMIAKLIDESELHQPADRSWWEQNAPEIEKPIEPATQRPEIIMPEQYGGPRRPPPEVMLRDAQQIALERAGVDQRSLTDKFDASKRLAARQELEKVMMEQAQQPTADERIAAAAARPQGPLTTSQTIARNTREGMPAREPTAESVDRSAATPEQPVSVGEGRTLTERMANGNNPRYAAAAGLGVGAANTDDEDTKTRGALLGAAALAIGSTEDIGRLPKALVGGVMKAVRNGEAINSIEGWAKTVDEATGGAYDARPVLQALADMKGGAELSRSDVVPALGDAAKKVRSPEKVAQLPSRQVIPWNERPNNGEAFFSRMRRAIEDNPAYDREMTPQQWLSKLQSDGSFSNTELDWTVGRALRDAVDERGDERGAAKLTRDDVLSMLDDKQVVVGHEQRGGQMGDGAEAPEASNDALDAEIERRLDSEIESAESREETEQEVLNRYRREAEEAIRTAAPGIRESDIDRALDRAIEDAYSTDSGIDPYQRAREIVSDLYDDVKSSPDESDLPEGWEVRETEPDAEGNVDHEWEVVDADGNRKGYGDGEYEALINANNEHGFFDEPDMDYLASEISAYINQHMEWSDAEREVFDRRDGDPDAHRDRIRDELEREGFEGSDTGGTEYAEYQRFSPRGTAYREHLVTLDSHGQPKTGSFSGPHFSGADNLAAHYRAEFYDTQPYRVANEVELAPMKEEVSRIAAEMEAFDNELIQRGVNPETGAGATQADIAHAQELKARHDAAVEALGQGVVDVRERGDTEKTYVLVEAQSDWAQKGHRLGFKRFRDRPLTQEEIEPLHREAEGYRAKEEEARLTQNKHSRVQESLQSDLRALNRRFAELDYSDAPDSERAELGKRVEALQQRSQDVSREWYVMEDERMAWRSKALAVEAKYADPNIENPDGIEATPFAETGAWVGLAVKSALWDAVNSGAERFAWSSSEARQSLASLPKKAADLVYDEIVPSTIEKTFRFLGIPFETSDVGVGGFKLRSVSLAPEVREKIKKVGFPLLGVTAAVISSSEKAEADSGDPRDGNPFATIGGLAAAAGFLYVATKNKAAGRALLEADPALKRILPRDDASGLFDASVLRTAKKAVDADPDQSWVVLRPARGARELPPNAAGKLMLRAIDAAGLPAQAFRTADGYALAVPSQRASGVLARIEDAAQRKGVAYKSAIASTYDAAATAAKSLQQSAVSSKNLGVILYSNPVGPAMQALVKYPSAAALGTLGYALTQLDPEEHAKLQATGVPLMILAGASVIGSGRWGALGGKVMSPLIERMRETQGGRRMIRALNPESLLPREVRDAIIDYEDTINRGRARGSELAARSRKLGPAGDRAVSDVVEREGWEDVSGMSADDVRNVLTVAAQYAKEFQALTSEKVRSGVLAPHEALPDYAGPRRYAEHEGAAVNANDETALFRRGGRGGKAARIAAQRSRTLDQPIREAEARLVAAQAGGNAQTIADAADALDEAKLLSLQARLTLGEIRESSYRGAQGMTQGYRDVAAADLLTTVRHHPDAIHPEFRDALDEFDAAKQMQRSALTPDDRQVAQDLMNQAKIDMADISRRFNVAGGDYVTLPSSAGLGALSGMVVKREIAAAVNGLPDMKGWGTFLRFWKEAKTVFNPGTHVGNILSNVGFAHMEGLHMIEQPRYLVKAALDMKRYGDATKALAENGTLDVNSVNADMLGAGARDMRSKEGLQELAGTTRPETAKVLAEKNIRPEVKSVAMRATPYAAGAAIGAGYGAYAAPEDERGLGAATGAAFGLLAGSKAARDFSKRLYANEDNIYRVAIYLKKIDSGMTPHEAADYAKSALGNFRSRSPALHMLRGSIAPFVLYPAKAVPRFAKQVVDHPWRYVTLMSMWALADQYARSEVGGVEERDLSRRDRSKWGYFFPGFTQLPFTGANGERAGVDVSRWTPLGSITTPAPPGSFAGSIDERVPAALSASGPIGDVISKFALNKDPMTGDQVVKPDYPMKENIASALGAAAEVALPPAAAFHRQRIIEDVANKDESALKNDLLGPTGLRPRYIRPGGNAMSSVFKLEDSLKEMQHDLVRALRKSKSPSRNAHLAQQYVERVRSAFANYRDRIGQPPPADLVKQAEDFANGQLENEK